MSAKYTPGKWEVVYVHGCPFGVGIRGKTGVGTLHNMVANVLFDSDKDKDLPRREADARLISAAPDSIEALREILACDSLATSIEWKGCPAGTTRRRSEAVAKARAAISKATGEKT